MVAQADLTPDTAEIQQHLHEITRRWNELGEPCLLETVMLSADDKAIVKDIRHFEPTPEGVAEAAQHVAAMNRHHLNAYAVVNPVSAERPPARNKRAATEHILASFFHWADADSPEAAQNIRNFVGAKCTMHVITGRTPHDRPHVFWQLEEPTRNLAAWEATQRAIAATLKTDPSVVDPPRIMRLAGTINWPKPQKRARGYVAELTRLRIYDPAERPPVSSERMARAFAVKPASAPFIDTGEHDHRTADEYIDILRRARTDGEKHGGVRDLAASLAGQGVSRAMAEAIIKGACPVWDDNVEHLIATAYEKYYRPGGEDPFAHEAHEAEQQEAADAGADGAEQAPKRDLAPVDIWGVFPAPDLPRGLLPKVIEDFAFIQGEQMGADPGGLAAAALCVCCAAISDDVKVRVKRYEDWHESARLWVALVGTPSTKKSPMLSAAERPLRAIDATLYKDFIRAKADYDALKKDEKAEATRPRQVRRRLEDTTIEAAQEVMADSPDGVLVVQDELSGWFGGMDRYSNGKGRDRSFWLQAFNGGVYAYNRIGRGAGMVDNLSACVLGGIQPEPIRGIVADAHDDGLIQRLFPIVLKPASLGSEDAPPSDAVRAYGDVVKALTTVEVEPPSGFIDVGGRTKPRLIFSNGAQAIRRDLEKWHLDLMAIECVSRKLAAHIGKYDGLFARLCVAFHAVEHAARGFLPPMISEDTARRAGRFLHRFLLPHAMAFYNGTLNLSDDHDRLTSLAGYILAHKLEAVSARDVARGDSTMRKLTRPDVVRLFEQLEALGWVAPQPTTARVNAAPTWVVNPKVHELFADRGAAEAQRRSEVARRMAEGKAGKGWQE